MTKPNYDYHGLLASTWDLGRGDTSNWSDRFFFLDVVRKYGQPVLDIGCGTGRILLDYVQQGIDIDGLDNSPEMLACCRDKARKLDLGVTLHQQCVDGFNLPRTYRTILAPSSTLQLLDLDQARSAVRCCFEHLQPGGALVSSFNFEWRVGDPLDGGWVLRFEKVRPEDGATVRRWEHEWHEPDKQLWHCEDRFEVELNGRLIASEYQRRSPEGRWYTQQQAAELFRDAGFEDIQLFHGFEHQPAQRDDRLFCVLGERRRNLHIG